MIEIKTEGIVVKKKEDFVVFTKDQGKIFFKTNEFLQPLYVLSLFLKKIDNIFIPLEIKVLYTFSKIKTSIKRLKIAYRILKLVDEFLIYNQPNQSIYFLLKQTIEELEEKEESLTFLYYFFFSLTKELGFWLDFKCCRCLKKSDEFFWTDGKLFCQNCKKQKALKITKETVKLIKNYYKGKILQIEDSLNIRKFSKQYHDFIKRLI